jgi:hypothetical protein
MNDTITQSVYQGSNMAQQVESQKRLAEAQKMQAVAQNIMNQYHMMQMQGLQQKAAQDLQMRQAFQDVRQPTQYIPSNTKAIASPESQVEELVPGQMGASPAMQAVQGIFAPEAREGVRSLSQLPGGLEMALQHLPKVDKNKQTFTLENILADEVRNKRMTLQEALGLKKQQEKTPNIPLFAEKSIGSGKIQKFKYNPETEEHDIPFGESYPQYKPSDIDYEGRALNKEQKYDLMAQRKLKGKFGAFPVVGIGGGTEFPTNPATNQQFTPQEWQSEYNKVYSESSGKGVVKKPIEGKILDAEEATKIYQEAGGDKNKARIIAKQRGYKF